MKELRSNEIEFVVGGNNASTALSGGIKGALGGAGLAAGAVTAGLLATPLGVTVLAGAALFGAVGAAYAYFTA